jgi:hypothetical protein
MKRLPNIRAFWFRGEDFLNCNFISSVMPCDRFLELNRCLHVVNPNWWQLERECIGQHYDY